MDTRKLFSPISEALQGMLLISQTPDPESRSVSPVDLQDRPIEDLSIEELRALAQIARKQTVCLRSVTCHFSTTYRQTILF